MKKPNVVLIADENLYDIFIRESIDIRHLELIEREIGPLFLTNSVASKINDKIPSISSDPQVIIPWRNKVQRDNCNYFSFLSNINEDVQGLLDKISEYQKYIKQILNKFDGGSTSCEDLEIFANAVWIGLNTSSMPFVLTDDKDLLGFGHLVASYLGFPVVMLSIYEILVIAQDFDALPRYCKFWKLPLPERIRSACPFPINKFGKDYQLFVKNTKIGFHPTWAGSDLLKELFS